MGVRTMSVQGYQVIFDLVWTAVDDGRRSTLVESSGNADMYCLVRHGTSFMAGYMNSESGKKLRNPVSFAAMLADAFKSEPALLYIGERENGDAIMVALVNGLPVPDCDRYGPLDDLLHAAKDFLREYPDARIIGQCRRYPEADEWDIDEWLNSKAMRVSAKKCKISPIASNSRQAFLITVAFCFAAFIAYDQYDTKRKAEEAAAQAAQQVDPSVVYAQGLTDAIAEKGMDPVDAYNIIRRLSSQRIFVGGWRLEKIECGTSACNEQWGRDTSVAKITDLIKDIGSLGTSLNVSNMSVSRTIPVGAKRASINTQALKPLQQTVVSVVDPIQSLGSSITLQVTPPNPMAVKGVTIPNGVKEGEIKVLGPLWMIDILREIPHGVLVKAFTITSSAKDPRFELTLAFFTN